MNERIKELAVQAGFYANPDVEKFEKFAELIVRECIDKIENEASQYAEPVWAVELVNDIKDHFEIE
jgi:hypothetical protein